MEIFGVLKRQDETPSSNVHLMTPFEDQQRFSTAQGLRKYQGCVVSNFAMLHNLIKHFECLVSSCQNTRGTKVPILYMYKQIYIYVLIVLTTSKQHWLKR